LPNRRCVGPCSSLPALTRRHLGMQVTASDPAFVINIEFCRMPCSGL
jgi:hypothetical protein